MPSSYLMRYVFPSLVVVREMERGRRKDVKGKMRQQMNTYLLQERRKIAFTQQ